MILADLLRLVDDLVKGGEVRVGVSLEGERDWRRSDWLGVLAGVSAGTFGELILSRKIRGETLVPLVDGTGWFGGDVGGVMAETVVARFDVGEASEFNRAGDLSTSLGGGRRAAPDVRGLSAAVS